MIGCLRLRLVCSLWGICICCSASATTVILFRTPDFVVVAADSKVSTPDGVNVGLTCKIHVSDNLVWVEAGFIEEPGGKFNIADIIRDAVHSDKSFEENVPDIKNAVLEKLSNFLPGYKERSPVVYNKAVPFDNFPAVQLLLVRGTSVARLDFIIEHKETPGRISIIEHDCVSGNCPEGEAFSYRMGTTEALDAEWHDHPSIISEMGVADAFVHLIKVQSDKTRSVVGGPVSVLRIQKDGQIEWLRPGYCERNDDKNDH
jgi:hypothetical protein